MAGLLHSQCDAPGPFDLDLRSLASFRISLGLVLLSDLWIRSYDFQAHYTEAGWLPQAALASIPDRAWSTSLFEVHPDGAWAALLFLVLLVCSLAYLVGWRTRLSGAACWLLTLHLQARNPMVLDGADMLLRHLLFWGLFLPLGARASVDAWRDPEAARGPPVARGLAAAALALQPVLLYEFAAMTKVQPAWVSDGMGVTYALMLDQLVKPWGRWLLGFPGVLWGLNYATIFWEYLGPVLLFSPVNRVRLRLFAMAGFVALQAGFGQTIRLMFFPWVATIALLPLVPGEVWDRLGWRHPPQAIDVTGRPWVRRPIQALAAGLFGYTLLWNIQALPDPAFRFPAWARVPGLTLRLEQQWYLFAPPWRTDGWYVVEGTRFDGSKVDLRTGEPLDASKPVDTYAAFASHRTWAFMRFLGYPASRPLRAHYLRSLRARCPGAEKLVRTRLVYFMELSLPDGTEAPPQEIVLYEEWRFGGVADLTGAGGARIEGDVPAVPGALER